MKKELTIYILVLVILSLIVHHEQFVNTPILHIENLPNSGAYGFGLFHPFLFSFIIYTLVLVPRAIFKLFKK